VDGLDGLLRLSPAAHIRLVGGDHEDEACGLQSRAAFRDPRQKPEFRDAARRIRFPFAHDRGIQGAVAIEEDRWKTAWRSS
jgi:hypothetical protein